MWAASPISVGWNTKVLHSSLEQCVICPYHWDCGKVNSRRAESSSSCRAQPPAQEKLLCCVVVGTVVSSPIWNELHQIFFGTSFPLNKFVCLEYTLQVLLTSSWSCAPCPGEMQRWKFQNSREGAVVFTRTLQMHWFFTDSPKLFCSSGLCAADGTM